MDGIFKDFSCLNNFAATNKSCVALDNNMLITLWTWYKSDTTIQKIRNVVLNQVFPRDIEISLVDHLSPLKINLKGRKTSTLIIEDIIREKKTIMDYKNCFGFCPFIFFNDKITKEPRLAVPDFMAGTFYSIMDENTYNNIVDWKPNTGLKYFSKNFCKEETDEDNDTDAYKVYVYCWEAPEHYSGMINSVLWPSFIDWCTYNEFLKNSLTADSINANPKTFLEQIEVGKRYDPKRVTFNSEDDYDNTFMGEILRQNQSDLLIGVGAQNADISYLNKGTAQRMDDTLQRFVNMNYGNTENRPSVDPLTKRFEINATKQMNTRNAVLLLPMGVKASRQIAASSQIDILKKKEMLEIDIMEALGVPLAEIKSNVLKGNQNAQAIYDKDRERFKTTKKNFREYFKECVERIIKMVDLFNINSKFFESIITYILDESYISRKNIKLDDFNTGNDAVKILTSFVEKKQVEAIQQTVYDYLQNLKKNSKVEIIYPDEQNETSNQSIENISKVFEMGGLKQDELIYLLRKNIGLTEYEKDDLIKTIKEDVPNELIKNPPIHSLFNKEINTLENPKPEESQKKEKPEKKKEKPEKKEEKSKKKEEKSKKKEEKSEKKEEKSEKKEEKSEKKEEESEKKEEESEKKEDKSEKKRKRDSTSNEESASKKQKKKKEEK